MSERINAGYVACPCCKGSADLVRSNALASARAEGERAGAEEGERIGAARERDAIRALVLRLPRGMQTAASDVIYMERKELLAVLFPETH